MTWDILYFMVLGSIIGSVAVLAWEHVGARQRCYFCWRTAHGSATVTETHATGSPVWSVQRWACHRHGQDAQDLAAGTVQRLAETSPWLKKNVQPAVKE